VFLSKLSNTFAIGVCAPPAAANSDKQHTTGSFNPRRKQLKISLFIKRGYHVVKTTLWRYGNGGILGACLISQDKRYAFWLEVIVNYKRPQKMLTLLDVAVLALYLLGVLVFGIVAGGRQRGTSDYFLGGRNLPWWAVCFSIVATETSTLTVIGIPAVAYGGSLVFLQLTLGYLIGRGLVAWLFLPRYFRGEMSTAYEFLGQRFGKGMQGTASVTFMITRLLADGVRLFATAIPIKVIADSAGIQTDYFQIIALIGLVTIVYTLIGGIRAVVWMDVVQMVVYIGGAIAALFILLGQAPAGWFAEAAAAGKTQVLDPGQGQPLSALLTQPYWLVTAIIGGAIFSMASHGTDQLIVQRLLACRNQRDSQKALVASGVLVIGQFALFLALGLLLWVHYGGATPKELGLTRGDEIFPRFIIEGMPPGVSGLLLAGIIAAAMSTLSSSLNALASSSVLDLLSKRKSEPDDTLAESDGATSSEAADDRGKLVLSRWLTLAWGIVFIGFANLFRDQQNPVVELGLSIASFTYGGLLGAFLLGMLNRRVRQPEAIAAFAIAIAVMVFVIFGLWHGRVVGGEGDATAWQVLFRPSKEIIEAYGLKTLAWPWFTTVGAALTVALGSLFALFRR
jgi:solute:Na+ symporter, SSS family